MNDAISPSHYKNATWEARHVRADVLRSMIDSGVDPAVAGYVYDALKYMLRAGRKGDIAEQIGKAREFLSFAQEALRRE